MPFTTHLADWLIETTWQVVVLASLVWLLQCLLKRWLSPAMRFAMWMVVAARLALPFLPASPCSIYALAKQGSSPASAPVIAAAKPVPLTVSVHVNPAMPVAAQFSPSPTPSAPFVRSVGWRDIVCAAWLAGALLCGVRLLFQAMRLARVRSQAREVSDLPCAIPGSVTVYESGEVRSPSLCGIRHPAILLPAGLLQELSAVQCRMILAHELAHLRRWDHWTDLLLRALHVIHWFNPAAYFVFTRCRLERELACDEAVLHAAIPSDRRLYGQVLLDFATSVRPAINGAPALPMAEGKSHLQRRIHDIAADQPRHRSVVLAVILLLLVAMVGLTRAQSPTASPSPRQANLPKVLPGDGSNDAPRHDASDTALEAALARRVDKLDLDDVPLERVLDTLQATNSIRIIVDWKTLAAVKVSPETPIRAIRLRERSLSRVLLSILNAASPDPNSRLEYYVDDGIIKITTHEARCRQQLSTRVYDVTDLQISMTPALAGDARHELEEIGKLIRETVDVQSWRENGGWGSMEFGPRNHSLVIRQDPETHRDIEALLQQLRDQLALQVIVECRFICLDPSRLPADLQKAFSPGTATAPPAAFVKDKWIQEFTRAASAFPEWSMTTAPRVTMFNGSEASVQACTSVPYVSGYKAGEDARGKTEYRPLDNHVEEGLTIRLRASVSADRKYVTLFISPKLTQLAGMDTLPWEGNEAAHQTLTIQRPNLQTRGMETIVSVPNQEAVLLGGFAGLPQPGPTTQPGSTALPKPASSTPANNASERWGRVFLLVRPSIIHAQDTAPTTRPVE
jgi:beta-lactamase regulating signal transducer with metallopeptidase domain